MVIVSLIIVYLLIGIIEIYPMIRKKEKNKIILYGILFILAFIISTLLAVGIHVPSPSLTIEKIVMSILSK